MTDARWLDVESDVAAAVRHFQNACDLHDAGGFNAEGLDGYRAQMALMHSLQSAHTSAEAALKRLMHLLDEETPQGEDWHYRLIERLRNAVSGDHERPAVLPDTVAKDLHETRAFRHRATHSYGEFDVSRAGPSLAAAKRLVASFPDAIEAFKRIIDPSEDRKNGM